MDNSVAIMGLPIANVSAREAVERIENLILSGNAHQVATANLDFWLNSLRDLSLHRVIAGCSLVLPDGMPLVWISRLLGTPLKQRVPGVDLVPMLAALSAEKGYRIYLLGGRPGVAERAACVLQQDFPGVQIVGYHSPCSVDIKGADHTDTLRRIRAANPDILLVAFGNPKQEEWIHRHAKSLRVPVSMGIGGSLDILVGDVRRSPKWMRQIGLEWLGRCVQEPARLLPRYLNNFSALALRLPFALLMNWLQRSLPEQAVETMNRNDGMIHLKIIGNLNRNTGIALNRTVASCIQKGQLLVVHLKDVRYADADGVGSLLDARQLLLANGLSLTLTGLSARIRILFHAWCVHPLFQECHHDQGRCEFKPHENGTIGFDRLIAEEAGNAATSQINY